MIIDQLKQSAKNKCALWGPILCVAQP